MKKIISGLENVGLVSVLNQDAGSRKLFTDNNIGENWKETSNLPIHICRFNSYSILSKISNFYSEVIFEIRWFWNNLFKFWDVDVSTFIDVCFIDNCFDHIFNQLKWINKFMKACILHGKQSFVVCWTSVKHYKKLKMKFLHLKCSQRQTTVTQRI